MRYASFNSIIFWIYYFVRYCIYYLPKCQHLHSFSSYRFFQTIYCNFLVNYQSFAFSCSIVASYYCFIRSVCQRELISRSVAAYVKSQWLFYAFYSLRVSRSTSLLNLLFQACSSLRLFAESPHNYIFLGSKYIQFLLLCFIQSSPHLAFLELPVLFQFFVETLEGLFRFDGVGCIEESFESAQSIPKIAKLSIELMNYLAIGTFDSEIQLKTGLKWTARACAFSLRFLRVSFKQCMVYFMEFMLLVTFFFENDSLPLTDSLLDLGSFSSPLCYKTEAGLFFMGLIIERKLFHQWCCRTTAGFSLGVGRLAFLGESSQKSIFLRCDMLSGYPMCIIIRLLVLVSGMIVSGMWEIIIDLEAIHNFFWPNAYTGPEPKCVITQYKIKIFIICGGHILKALKRMASKYLKSYSISTARRKKS